ncbi:MAG: hypothetical protein KF760_09450 [Candidatus Eremiobacteraeota bacterium]|nr:hypothetical protein [Candidatus Eremiobacteraeota bacterium]MCW5866254.1 hypothetical protein [Candidatus Eremiobacteraeota bacterium]
MQINPFKFFTSPKVEPTSTATTTPTPSLQQPVAAPLEQFTPSAAPKTVPDLPLKTEAPPQPVEAKLPPAPQLKSEPPVESKLPAKESWMDQDWNLGPGSNAKAEPHESLWKYPTPQAPIEHKKMMVVDDEATYFVGGGESKGGEAKKSELDPLMAKFTELSKNHGLKKSSDHLGLGVGAMAGVVAGMAGMAGMGGIGMLGMMPSMNSFFSGVGSAGKFNQDILAHEIGHASPSPNPSGFGGGITNFSHLAAEQQKFLEDLKKLDKGAPSSAQGSITNFNQMALEQQTALQDLAKAQEIKNTAAVSEAKPVPTCGGLTRAQVIQGVDAKLAALGKTSVRYSVDEKMFSSMDKLNLDPVDFFTARACWQGVSTKRRAVLEKVLDQFPELPKDQKNWQAAVASAEAKGTKITDTDKVFIQYFIENRKAMKSLFRATLPSGFQGNSAICYRGQSNSSEYGPHSTKPLGCYSIDPEISESWATGGNLKQFKVKLSDVWSTYTATQNNNRCERELTVYSRGGIRRGEKVKDIPAAKREFQASYAGDKLAKDLETSQYNKSGW